MILALIAGTVFGFLIAIPPGPIAMTNIRLGLEGSKKECALFALGTASLDMLYCLVAVFAASAIQGAVNSYLDNNPLMSLFFQIIVVAGLIYFGIRQFRSKLSASETFVSKSKKPSPEFIDKMKRRGSLFLGFALAMTNLANPTFVPSLTVLSAWVHKTGLFPGGFNNNVIFALGFGIGNFLWLYALAWVVIRNRHRLSDNTVLRIKQFAGIVFVLFGVLIGYRIIVATNWSQIF